MFSNILVILLLLVVQIVDISPGLSRYLVSEAYNKEKKELQNKTKEPAIKEIVKEKKPKKDIPLRAKNDPRQKN